MRFQYPQELLSKIKNAPKTSGCYLYSDRFGNLIYVGKAKNLRTRVSSYFSKTGQSNERLQELLSRISDVEYRPTETELDALILEYRLIKEFKPWFNSQMKPDVQRPWLRIDSSGNYATMRAVAERAKDSAQYYDFFMDEEDIRDTLTLFGDIWGTARCGKTRFTPAGSPCLYHSLGQCMAPCAEIADVSLYTEAVDEIRRLLAGKRVKKTSTIQKSMTQSAQALAFEQAAQYRQQLEHLKRLQIKCRRWYHFPEDAGVLVLIRPFREKTLTLFYVKNNQTMCRLDLLEPPTFAELEQYASEWNTVQNPLPDSAWLTECLTEISADKTFVRLPKKVTGQRLLREIEKNEKRRNQGN